MVANVVPDFSGKVVKAYFLNQEASRYCVSLVSPTFENQSGRLFLVGKVTNPENGWGEATVVYVAWDSVSFYSVEPIEDRHRRKFGGFGHETIG